MKRALQFLFDPRGVVGRRVYLGTGAALFALKYLIDLGLARGGFGYSWWPTDYFLPRAGRIEPGTTVPLHVFLALIGLALPFIWAGVALTIKRLTAMGWPAYLAAGFFLPYLNFGLFAVLSVVRGASSDAGEKTKGREVSGFILVPGISLIGVGLIWFATIFTAYGWGLFVGIPFFLGFFPALMGNAQTYRACLRLTAYALLLVAALLVVIKIEGLICLAMAAPLAMVIALIGASIGFVAKSASTIGSRRAEIGCASFFFVAVDHRRRRKIQDGADTVQRSKRD